MPSTTSGRGAKSRQKLAAPRRVNGSPHGTGNCAPTLTSNTSKASSASMGSQVSHGLSYQKLGKELMTQDELAVMDGGKCIFMLRGVRPFLSDKYDLTRHPNYRYTADADPKNVFDMERYMKKQRAVVKPTDTFDVYEIDATT